MGLLTITSKKINRTEDYPVAAVFAYQGILFEERYKSNKTLLHAVKRGKRYEFINAVNYKSFQVFSSRNDLLAKVSA